MSKPPKRFQQFQNEYPRVAKAYDTLGTSVHEAGPLDEKTRALVKLGISAGARLQGAFHSHVRKALAVGVTVKEIKHAVLLTLPTIGLPSMMAALSWIDDVVNEEAPKRKKKKA
jgi:alkylhydroperoxidase/carboxymuconolactone decarboxylase family protein YurZ